MKDSRLKRIERALFLVFIMLGVIAVVGILLMLRIQRGGCIEHIPDDELESTDEDYDWEAGLSDSTVWLPDNCSIYGELPHFTIEDEDGNEHHINEFSGKKAILVFWASWCPDCQEQMPNMKDYEDLAATYGDIQFIYINKTDGTKETKTSAQAYFDKLGIDEPLYFDNDLYAYNCVGLHNIPTTMFIDENQQIISWSPKQIADSKTFESYLDNLVHGNSASTASFVTKEMMDENGGVHSTFDASNDSGKQSDVLSESQGLMMQYALQKNDEDLFKQLLDYTTEIMTKDGLAAWTVANGEPSRVNALLDDLRIYRAILGAQQQWGGYEKALYAYRENLIEYGINGSHFVDFYDAEHEQKAHRLTLCYIDLKTMEQLAQGDENAEQAYDEAKEILSGGQISEEFPLYYSWYDYDTKSYQKDELNMAEAMVTLLHLAENDMLPENTVKWLSAQMSGDGIKARMNVSGEVVDGYNYDSTAIYALVAMIGDELDNEKLRGQALRRMEKMRIHNFGVNYNGAFGMEDGSQIQSFDQLLPLLVYSRLENK